MRYEHRSWSGEALDLPVGKVVCVGRNYAEHAKELGNVVPEEPMLFIKPATSLVRIEEPLRLPAHGRDIHHELELAALIGSELRAAAAADVVAAIVGYALAIDLTARDVQSALKKKGQPWELAKAFDGACPISGFVPSAEIADPQATELRLAVNGEVRQHGSTRDMVTPTPELCAYASRFFTLLPGDVVLTGTPAGVGPLAAGDVLELDLDGRFRVSTRVET